MRYTDLELAEIFLATIPSIKPAKYRKLLVECDDALDAMRHADELPYDVLGKPICQHAKRVYLNGMTGPKIREAVEAVNATEKPELIDCKDFYDAVACAAADAEPGDIVLMSPASAAFDQFKNFMERGKIFKKLIKEL